MRALLFVIGVVMLIAAGLCRFVVAPQYTQRIPPGWQWSAKFLGASSYPDEATGQFPPKDEISYYEREIKIADETGRPREVVLTDRYAILDHESRKPVWEYIIPLRVDPATGAHVDPEFLGSVALFPRDTEKKTYVLRSNYLKGAPVAFQREEIIEGLNTYLFSYSGPPNGLSHIREARIIRALPWSPGRRSGPVMTRSICGCGSSRSQAESLNGKKARPQAIGSMTSRRAKSCGR